MLRDSPKARQPVAAWLFILQFCLPSLFLPAAGCSSWPDSGTGEAAASGGLSLDEFLAGDFFSGVPYAEAAAYGQAAVPELIQVLQNPVRQQSWSVAATMLAMIAEPEGVNAVVSFIERPPEPAITPQFRWARSNAVLALGYAANNQRSMQALNYLVESLEPGVWSARGIQTAPDAETGDYETESGEGLTESAILGLALSGTMEGKAAIEVYRNSPMRTAQQRDMADAALVEHARVVALGLVEYDRRRHSHDFN